MKSGADATAKAATDANDAAASANNATANDASASASANNATAHDGTANYADDANLVRQSGRVTGCKANRGPLGPVISYLPHSP